MLLFRQKCFEIPNPGGEPLDLRGPLGEGRVNLLRFNLSRDEPHGALAKLCAEGCGLLLRNVQLALEAHHLDSLRRSQRIPLRHHVAAQGG